MRERVAARAEHARCAVAHLLCYAQPLHAVLINLLLFVILVSSKVQEGLMRRNCRIKHRGGPVDTCWAGTSHVLLAKKQIIMTPAHSEFPIERSCTSMAGTWFHAPTSTV